MSYWQCRKECYNHYELNSFQCKPRHELALLSRAHGARSYAAELQHMHGRWDEVPPSAFFPYFKMAARILLKRSRNRPPLPLP